MKVVDVYDIFSSVHFYRYNLSEYDNQSNLLFDSALRHGFVACPAVKNKQQYLIDPDAPVLEEFFILSPWTWTVDTEGVETIEEMATALINLKEDENFSYVNKLSSYLHKYFEKQKLLLPEITDNALTVLPVPDALCENGQELLLFEFGNRMHTKLLWRSIAIFLGLEKKLQKLGLKKGDLIAIADCFHGSVLVTCLELEDIDGRLVPCRKNFRNAHGKINEDAYPGQYTFNLSNSFRFQDTSLSAAEKKLAVKVLQGGKIDQLVTKQEGKYKLKSFVINQKKIPDAIQEKVNDLLGGSLQEKVSLCVIFGNQWSRTFFRNSKNLLFVEDESILSRGCTRFVSYLERNMVPYFDECGALNLVTQHNGELIYTTLIKANNRCPGGKEVYYKDDKDAYIDGISIGKGEKSVKFFLHMGDNADVDQQLKQLEQHFNMKEDTHQDWPLKLYPKMIPGQGRAQVNIICGLVNGKRPFSQVSLDWKELALAYDDNEGIITLNSLRSQMKRGYPPEVSLVRSKGYIDDYILKEWELNTASCKKRIWNYQFNRSRWPNKNNIGVDRFVRENLFGNDPYYRYPHGIGYSEKESQEIIERFFTQLAAWYDDYPEYKDQIVSIIAWTYQGTDQPFFRNIIYELLKEVESAAEKRCPIKAQYLSLCINLLEKEEDLVRFFKLLVNRLEYHDSLNNWLRSLYQLLMYHRNFLGAKEISLSLCEKCMNSLIDCLIIYLQNREPINIRYTLLSMLFLLKRRFWDPEFCKKDSTDGLYKKIVCIDNGYFAYFYNNKILYKTLLDYLDNQGTIEGIPLED
ncbi:MAG: hypothetical protein LKE40_05340 [Spirochaetia bacterium]|jgi:hypothetical protein|nr:hypothetical protein [Spirochaetia bacterium]